MAERTRNSMFFISDADTAAHEAAGYMRDHGLDENEVDDLGRDIAAAIEDFFSNRDESGGAT